MVKKKQVIIGLAIGAGLAGAYYLATRRPALPIDPLGTPRASIPPINAATVNPSSVRRGQIPTGPGEVSGVRAFSSMVVISATGHGSGDYTVNGNTVEWVDPATGITRSATITSYQADGLPKAGVATIDGRTVAINFQDGHVVNIGDSVGTRVGIFPGPNDLDPESAQDAYNNRGGLQAPPTALHDLDTASKVAAAPNLVAAIADGLGISIAEAQKEAITQGYVSFAIDLSRDAKGYSIPEITKIVIQEYMIRNPGVSREEATNTAVGFVWRAASSGGFDTRINPQSYPNGLPASIYGTNPSAYPAAFTLALDQAFSPAQHTEHVLAFQSATDPNATIGYVPFSTVAQSSDFTRESPVFRQVNNLSKTYGPGTVYVSNDFTTIVYHANSGQWAIDAIKAGAGTQVGAQLPTGIPLTGDITNLKPLDMGVATLFGFGPSQFRFGTGATSGGATFTMIIPGPIVQAAGQANVNRFELLMVQRAFVTEPLSKVAQNPIQLQAARAEFPQFFNPDGTIKAGQENAPISHPVGLNGDIANARWLTDPRDITAVQTLVPLITDYSTRTGVNFWAPQSTDTSLIIPRPDLTIVGSELFLDKNGRPLGNPYAAFEIYRYLKYNGSVLQQKDWQTQQDRLKLALTGVSPDVKAQLLADTQKTHDLAVKGDLTQTRYIPDGPGATLALAKDYLLLRQEGYANEQIAKLWGVTDPSKIALLNTITVTQAISGGQAASTGRNLQTVSRIGFMNPPDPKKPNSTPKDPQKVIPQEIHHVTPWQVAAFTYIGKLLNPNAARDTQLKTGALFIVGTTTAASGALGAVAAQLGITPIQIAAATEKLLGSIGPIARELIARSFSTVLPRAGPTAEFFASAFSDAKSIGFLGDFEELVSLSAATSFAIPVVVVGGAYTITRGIEILTNTRPGLIDARTGQPVQGPTTPGRLIGPVQSRLVDATSGKPVTGPEFFQRLVSGTTSLVTNITGISIGNPVSPVGSTVASQSARQTRFGPQPVIGTGQNQNIPNIPATHPSAGAAGTGQFQFTQPPGPRFGAGFQQGNIGSQQPQSIGTVQGRTGFSTTQSPFGVALSPPAFGGRG